MLPSARMIMREKIFSGSVELLRPFTLKVPIPRSFHSPSKKLNNLDLDEKKVISSSSPVSTVHLVRLVGWVFNQREFHTGLFVESLIGLLSLESAVVFILAVVLIALLVLVLGLFGTERRRLGLTKCDGLGLTKSSGGAG